MQSTDTSQSGFENNSCSYRQQTPNAIQTHKNPPIKPAKLLFAQQLQCRLYRITTHPNL